MELKNSQTGLHSFIPKYLLIILIIFNHILASWYVLHGNINFNVDIARDFLLFEDIVDHKNITLIGPRSGGIPGVFHGPLWLYIHIPAYIIGQGNPVVVGWFWVGLLAISSFIVYYVGKKIFDNTTTGLLAALMYSVVSASSAHAIFNPFGAVMCAPLFIYFLYKYNQKQGWFDLIASLFLLGIIIQFQMAFGIPILLLVFPYLLYLVFKYRKFKHILLLPIIIIPLSSFILFELRHDFLQFKSVLTYLSDADVAGKQHASFSTIFVNRFVVMTKETIGMITQGKLIFTLLISVSFMYAVWKKPKKYISFYYLFICLLVGYFAISLLYKGVMWSYYFWPFLGIIAIIFASLQQVINKKLFFILFTAVYISNVIVTWKSTVNNPFLETDASLWTFYKNIAAQVYEDAPTEFGYYIYTNDLFGYSSRYAMNYVQKKYPDKKAFSFAKKGITYLLIDDEGTHKLTNNKDWKKYDVKIEKMPLSKIKINRTYVIEKYSLTPEEMAIESNPNLIHTLIFR